MASSAVVRADEGQVHVARIGQHVSNPKGHVLELGLARLGDVEAVENFGKGTARGTVDGVDIGLPLADILDLDAERARLQKTMASVEDEISKISRKLDNPGFVAKAPAAVVEENRRRLDEENTRRSAIEAALARLG